MTQKLVVFKCIVLAYCWLMHATLLQAGPDGDINTDGQIDAVDILWGQQVLFENRSLLPDQFIHGDVAPLVLGNPQPNGVFDLGDVLIIQRIVLGMLNYSLPGHQFNIGDSIGEGEAADGTIGEAHHETVWSTGYNAGDSVNSLNERFETIRPVEYYENNASRDPVFNHAVSGSVMADFSTQAQNVIAASAQTPPGEAAVVNVFLGSNDVCAPNMASMTDPAVFETQYRAGLDVLAADTGFSKAQINVSSIPAIYWLWNAKRSVFWCRVFVWPFVPCENLLDNPSDDCESSISRGDPDNVYPGDGVNCQRRKEFHRLTRDAYNPILRDVLTEYRESGALPNARFTDIFDVRFESSHVNSGDCFHPSTDGHALLADKEWCKTHWGKGDPGCAN